MPTTDKRLRAIAALEVEPAMTELTPRNFPSLHLTCLIPSNSTRRRRLLKRKKRELRHSDGKSVYREIMFEELSPDQSASRKGCGPALTFRPESRSPSNPDT